MLNEIGLERSKLILFFQTMRVSIKLLKKIPVTPLSLGDYPFSAKKLHSIQRVFKNTTIDAS